MNISTYTKRAITGGVISAMIAGMGFFLIGNLSQYEAKSLIKSSVPGVNMLCNTIVLASATIMALLLTVLGLSSKTDSRLKNDHYQQVKRLG
jgi:RsiW-degrading membrane proteinase PrsW (M82 family)